MVRQNVDSIVSRGLEFVSELRSELENKLGGVAPIPIKVWSPSEMEFVPMIKGPPLQDAYICFTREATETTMIR